jgi:hypothetical protein
MPRVSNQEIEKYYFEMFRKDYPLPSGTVEYSDKPDIVLRGERTLGIEITNLFLEDGSLPESEQIQRRDRGQAVTEAERIYAQSSADKFVLTFSFNEQVPIRDANEVARRISRFASRIPRHRNGVVWKESFSDIPELSFVYLNTKAWEGSCWRISQMYSTPFLSSALLSKAIQEKDEKSKGYRPCDAYWLLAVIDFMDRAQDQEIQLSACETVSSTVFEKIIIYKTHFGQILEVDRRA